MRGTRRVVAHCDPICRTSEGQEIETNAKRARANLLRASKFQFLEVDQDLFT